VIVQPGGKGSNVARVFRQLGGDVVLVGFVGRANGRYIADPLRQLGVHIDVVSAFDGESRTCTVICDRRSNSHPTVVNEESPMIDSRAGSKLVSKIESWIPRADGVLTTGSLSRGLADDFYAGILDRARAKGKMTAIDAAGDSLRIGLLARPHFMKPNAEEFFRLTHASNPSPLFMFARHTALTFGKAGALLVHDGKFMYAAAPQVCAVNPIGAGDAFTAAYLKYLLDGASTVDCLRYAVAAAACDAATLRPGFVDPIQVNALTTAVEPRFLRSMF